MRLLLIALICLLAMTPHFGQTHKFSVAAFFNEPFGAEESIAKLQNFGGIKFKTIKEPVSNIHDKGVIDTVYHLKKCKNHIWVYKSATNAFIYNATLTSRKAKLSNGVGPGTSREVFYKSFTNLKPVDGNIHTFPSPDGTGTATVIFKRNKVKSINIVYNID